MTAAASVAFETEVITLAMGGLERDGVDPAGRKALHPGIAKAAAVLSAGEVVAIPTETVYGLAANALSASAVGRVYAAKNRPADNPLIVHVASLEMLASLYPPGWALPPVYEAVVRDLWPGPLTILLPRSSHVPEVVTCGQPTMAVRMPAHPVALSLIAACGFPLAAPSANSSGRPSPTLARHVLADLGGRVPLILDGGACTCGLESTVLDGLREPPAILRPGGVTREQLAFYPGLERLLVYRRDFVDPQLEAAPSTPGMKYRHYSPAARVLLLDPGDAPTASVSDEELAARLRRGAEVLLAEELATADAVKGAAGLQEAAGPAEQQQQDRRQGHLNGGAAVKPAARVGLMRTSLAGLRPGPLPQQPAAALLPPHGGPCGGGGVSAALAGAGDDGCCYEYVLGHLSRPTEVASELFAALRHMDEVGVAVIVVEGVRDAGAGVAVMNRLRKAASRVVAV